MVVAVDDVAGAARRAHFYVEALAVENGDQVPDLSEAFFGLGAEPEDGADVLRAEAGDGQVPVEPVDRFFEEFVGVVREVEVVAQRERCAE